MVDVTWLRPVCIAFRRCFDVQWHAPNAWCCSPWSHSNNGKCFIFIQLVHKVFTQQLDRIIGRRGFSLDGSIPLHPPSSSFPHLMASKSPPSSLPNLHFSIIGMASLRDLLYPLRTLPASLCLHWIINQHAVPQEICLHLKPKPPSDRGLFELATPLTVARATYHLAQEPLS